MDVHVGIKQILEANDDIVSPLSVHKRNLHFTVLSEKNITVVAIIHLWLTCFKSINS